MTLDELHGKSILILGFGREGQGTYKFLRQSWPSKPLAIADQRSFEELELPPELRSRVEHDTNIRPHLGDQYLANLFDYQCVVKTAGIPASRPELQEAERRGITLTSHMEIFFSNYPAEMIVGVTGTKGKSTTT